MGTLLIKGSITSEIQSHPVSVSSYHPNKDLEGECGFIITRRVGERNKIIVQPPAQYMILETRSYRWDLRLLTR